MSVTSQPEDGAGEPFDHRAGLDHFGLKVADQDDLDRWITHLDRLGIPRSPVQLELWVRGRRAARPQWS